MARGVLLEALGSSGKLSGGSGKLPGNLQGALRFKGRRKDSHSRTKNRGFDSILVSRPVWRDLEGFPGHLPKVVSGGGGGELAKHGF